MSAHSRAMMALRRANSRALHRAPWAESDEARTLAAAMRRASRAVITATADVDPETAGATAATADALVAIAPARAGLSADIERLRVAALRRVAVVAYARRPDDPAAWDRGAEARSAVEAGYRAICGRDVAS